MQALSGTVLVADDQPDILEAMRLLLKGGGFAVETVSSPSAVIERADRTDYDVVLIDLNYTRDTTSGIEGMDLLARLRSQSNVPVIVMTAWATVDLAVEALRRGANDFIQKPWNNAQVLETVRKHIEKRQEEEKRRRWALQDRESAKSLHDSLLRTALPQLAGIEVAVWSRPKFDVGGDYYEACETSDGKLLFCIADACGKGISATIQMSNLQGALKASAGETDPAGLCRQLNRILRGNLPAGRFVSLFVGILDPVSGKLAYCNAGHLPPVLLRKSGRCETLLTGGAVLGYFAEYEYETGHTDLTAGDSVVLFTDGISEAADPQGVEFGDSIETLLPGLVSLSATGMRDRMVDAVQLHCCGEFPDDATLLMLQRAAA